MDFRGEILEILGISGYFGNIDGFLRIFQNRLDILQDIGYLPVSISVPPKYGYIGGYFGISIDFKYPGLIIPLKLLWRCLAHRIRLGLDYFKPVKLNRSIRYVKL